jgi:hypothetical protein
MEPFDARGHAAALAIVATAVSAGILAWAVVTVTNVNDGSPARRSAENGGAFSVAAQRSNRMIGADLARPDFALTFTAVDTFAPRAPSAIPSGGTDAQIWNADENPDWLRTVSLLPSAPGGEPTRSWPGEPAERASAAIAPSVPAAETQADLAAPVPEELADLAAPATATVQPKALHTAAPVHNLAPRPHKVAAAARTYLEKVPEQGDAGDVSFRYRRRACTPGNMIDVCYMPEANRARIVVERW